MPNGKKGSTPARPPRRDVLASLRMASMEDIARGSLPAGALSLAIYSWSIRPGQLTFFRDYVLNH